MIDIGKVPVSVRSVSKNLDKIRTDRSNTEKEKKRIARKKERRATLILGKVQLSSKIQKSWKTLPHISFPFNEKKPMHFSYKSFKDRDQAIKHH